MCFPQTQTTPNIFPVVPKTESTVKRMQFDFYPSSVSPAQSDDTTKWPNTPTQQTTGTCSIVMRHAAEGNKRRSSNIDLKPDQKLQRSAGRVLGNLRDRENCGTGSAEIITPKRWLHLRSLNVNLYHDGQSGYLQTVKPRTVKPVLSLYY